MSSLTLSLKSGRRFSRNALTPSRASPDEPRAKIERLSTLWASMGCAAADILHIICLVRATEILVNCDHAQRVLDAYLDKELDVGTHAQLTQHLATCAGCGTLLAERDALRAGLCALPRLAAPAALRESILHALPVGDGMPAPAVVRHVPWWAALSLAASAAVFAFVLGLWVASPPGVTDLREAAITRHVASLGSGQTLVQVSSADRHQVKPWFAGRIDFAPPVRDLDGHGFMLVGGRLDTLADQTAAVIVYRIRRHDISLFVSPTPAVRAMPITASTLRGFAVVSWAQEGLSFVAVSDVDPGELKRFAALLRLAAER